MRPRVLLLGYFLSAVPGSRGVCEELAERLGERGWTVLTSSRRRRPLQRVLDMILAAAGVRGAYGVATLDVYSGRAFAWAEVVAAVVRMRRRPLLLVLRGGALPDLARRSPRRVRRLLMRAHTVVSPSAYLREAFLHLRPDLVHIPNAVAWEDQAFRLRAPAEPEILWLRSFHDVYDPALAPRVLYLVAERLPKARLRMVGPDRGDGSLERARAEAGRLGMEDRIEFVGPVPKDRIPGLLAEADIYLNTARVDNAPVSVLEAMAGGLCVVTTDVGGIPFICRHGEDAIVAPAGDAGALARGIVDLVEDPDLAGRISGNARASVEPYRWSRVLPRWEEVLGAAAGEAPTRRGATA